MFPSLLTVDEEHFLDDMARDLVIVMVHGPLELEIVTPCSGNRKLSRCSHESNIALALSFVLLPVSDALLNIHSF